VYVRPRLENRDEPTTFGVSGKLWRSAVVLYDRQTLSLWAQIGGRAIAGPSSGHQLAEIPAELTTWSRWKAQHPETLALVKPVIEDSPYAGYYKKAGFAGIPWMRHRDKRLPEKELVLGIRQGEEALALPFAVASEHELLHLEVGGKPLLVVSESLDRGLDEGLRIFHRRVGDVALDFERGSTLRDRQTGSVWDQRTGEALEGSLLGERLERVAASPVYFGIWVKYYPETEIYRLPQ